MPYRNWYKNVVTKIDPSAERKLYRHVLIFALAIFGVLYAYMDWQGMDRILNKAVADTSIILIGFSMMLSALCYFWDFVDTKIIYRKHLGLVGFAFALGHMALSFSLVERLFSLSYWLDPSNLRFTSAGAAIIIFTIMALVSNKYAASELGGKVWRLILRTGYIGVTLIWLHVYLLKSKQWFAWYEGGMEGAPSAAMLVTIFMTLVIFMRIALWLSLLKKARAVKR